MRDGRLLASASDGHAADPLLGRGLSYGETSEKGHDNDIACIAKRSGFMAQIGGFVIHGHEHNSVLRLAWRAGGGFQAANANCGPA